MEFSLAYCIITLEVYVAPASVAGCCPQTLSICGSNFAGGF